jgi:hypothetical protein
MLLIGAQVVSSKMGTRGFFLRIKREGREADHSPLSSAEVKNTWSYISSLPYVFMAWCFNYRIVLLAWYLVNYQDFTLPYHTPS